MMVRVGIPKTPADSISEQSQSQLKFGEFFIFAMTHPQLDKQHHFSTIHPLITKDQK